MAAKLKALASPLVRSLSQTHSLSGWKNSLGGAINSQRCLIHTTGPKQADVPGVGDSMSFVKGILADDMGNTRAVPLQQQLPPIAEKPHIVHIKLLQNNAFITITDSEGNKKLGVSSGSLDDMKDGGPKLSRYSADATAEHAGRIARNMGLKSVVIKINGYIYFKKKKQAILSWREGFNFGKGDRCPITYIEDTTRMPHNGCRLRKKRRY